MTDLGLQVQSLSFQGGWYNDFDIILTVSRTFSSATLPHTRRGLCSTRCRCLPDGDWGFCDPMLCPNWGYPFRWQNKFLHTSHCAPWCVSTWEPNTTKFPSGYVSPTPKRIVV